MNSSERTRRAGTRGVPTVIVRYAIATSALRVSRCCARTVTTGTRVRIGQSTCAQCPGPVGPAGGIWSFAASLHKKKKGPCSRRHFLAFWFRGFTSLLAVSCRAVSSILAIGLGLCVLPFPPQSSA